MSSIKQLIVNAIIKVSGENPALDVEGGLSAVQARDDFIRLLLVELFPEDPSVPVVKTKKTKPVPEKKTEVVVEPTLVTDSVVTSESVPETSPGKKKRAPMTEEAKIAMKTKRDATVAAKKSVSPPVPDSVVETSGSNAAAGGSPAPEPEAVKEKKTKKPKIEKTSSDVNLQKIDPTWKKHLKNADKDHAKDLEPDLLKYLNGLSKDDFNAKKAEEHVVAFLESRKPVADDGKVEADLDIVEFEGKDYYVNPETKRVYEGEGSYDAETGWTNYKAVGYAGMAVFESMKLD